uniref:Na+/H+ antiporter n=1 Tax=Vibrio coralliilyticus TaxID=190893 RepID=M1FV95_9VIBR|nr:Na+/H+ antiporter [Vibrio coralliilyticus]
MSSGPIDNVIFMWLAGVLVLHFGDGHVFSAIVQSFLSIVEYSLTSLADRYNAGIILQVLVIGGLIALMTKMGGTKAVANALANKAKGPISAQVVSWILGLLLFFDDYANALIVGPVMRPVTDEKKISREKLAFVVDATAAPVAGNRFDITLEGILININPNNQ